MTKKQQEEETILSEETIPSEETDVENVTEEESNPSEKTELEKAQESLNALTDRLMRTAAEFDNYKKRSAREKDEVYGNAVCETVAKLLPVLDNLERAISTSTADHAENSVLDGVKMIQKQFLDALTEIGVSAMDAVGSTFDPEKHNAVMTEENDGEENVILEEFMKGYLYRGEKVVRHSMVKVSC